MLAMVNVDNIAGDILPYIIDSIIDLGAKNVHCIQALTKKGRLGYLFFIDTEEEYLNSIADFLALEVGVLGMRVLETQHQRYDYLIQPVRLSIQDGSLLPAYEALIDVKLVVDEKGEIISARAEYEHIEASCRELRARGYNFSLLELKARAELEAMETCQPRIENIDVKAVKCEPVSSPRPATNGSNRDGQ